MAGSLTEVRPCGSCVSGRTNGELTAAGTIGEVCANIFADSLLSATRREKVNASSCSTLRRVTCVIGVRMPF